jgi:triacylglycerol esterase/lipase EstA (alpha/beta hydrolase family)
VLIGLAALLALLAAPAAARAADPPLTGPEGALRAALACPSRFAHANHPPVLLVHGTGTTPEESWSWNYQRALPADGYDACTVRLPDRALGDIQASTEYVVWAVERMHALTGRRVAVVTHSQGGMEGRWAVRWWAGARAAVDDLIDLASPNHGIYGADACAGSGNCWAAVWQMREGSAFLRALNGDEALGRVSYSQLYSRTDELVEPSTTVPLRGDPARVANVAVQDLCPGRPVHHVGMVEDAVVYALALDAIAHPGPANPARIDPALCAQALMPGVTPLDAATGNTFLYGEAAIAFAQHPGVTSEPPLRDYATA